MNANAGFSSRRSPVYQRAAVEYASVLRRRMHERNVTRNDLARAVGVSGTAVGLWQHARYLPRPDIAELVGSFLASEHLIALASQGRKIRCEVCNRTTWRGSTRRRYCSVECRHKGTGAVLTGPQAAIDAFCHDCEPEGLCRTPACPLQPFSPLPLIEVRRPGAAA